ncbi:monovalent cation/H(+) antiporter subunit G [Nitriliruptor alkaliphilus]|uniref:monovalent cation/H(+) antiporter subunit G n=1 Tax=Nitriliruptor alkaliphilus TaxID=427918 RepID=UPI00069870F0|nr:monovalent cation/H(+) antiporter subunit G [Nitriliruptor alkaliphilus]
MSTVIANGLILMGVSLVVLGGVAVLRLPDVLARTNAATKAAGLGLASILAGTAVALGTRDAYLKLGLAIVVQFITAPVAGHVLGRAAYRASPEELTRFLAIDDLADGDGGVPPPRSGDERGTTR